MHELSLMSSIVDHLKEKARTDGFTEVLALKVGIGVMSGVNADTLNFCFEEVTRGTLMEGSRLLIEPIALQVACLECGAQSESEMDDMQCRHCGSTRVRIMGGTELKILEAEVR